MAQDPSNDRVDGMEIMEKMSFDDLPDIAIIQVMEKLDLRSRFMMRRVSKKMNGLQFKIKNNLEKIRIKYPRLHHSGVLAVTERGFEPVTFPLRDDTVMEDAISRLAVNSHVNKMEQITWGKPVLDAIDNFEVDEQDIYNLPFRWLADPFLQPGRLLKINTTSCDLGWGVIAGFIETRRIPLGPREIKIMYTLQVLIALDPSSADDVSNLAALKQPQAGGEVVWKIVPMPIDCVNDLSTVSVDVPHYMKSKEAKDKVVRRLKYLWSQFPSLPMLDPMKDGRR